MANGEGVDLKKLVKRRKSTEDKENTFLTKSLINENLDSKLVTKNLPTENSTSLEE